MVLSSEKFKVLAKSTICPVFPRNEALFATSVSKVRQNAKTRWFLRKSSKYWPNRRFFPFFREMRNFLPLLAEKFVKTPKHGGLFEQCPVFAKLTSSRVSSRNEQVSANLGWKGRQNAETLWLLWKVWSFRQIDELSCFFAKWGTL